MLINGDVCVSIGVMPVLYPAALMVDDMGRSVCAKAAHGLWAPIDVRC